MIMDHRQKESEARLKHDESTRFRIQARRDFLFGLWVAERLGLQPADQETYAQSMVAAGLEKPGDEDIFAKVAADMKIKGVSISKADMDGALAKCQVAAQKDVSSH